VTTVGDLRYRPDLDVMMVSMSAQAFIPAPVPRQDPPLLTDLRVPTCKPSQRKMAQWPKKISNCSRIAVAYLLVETGWVYLRRDRYR